MKCVGNRITDCGRNACEFVSHAKFRGNTNTCALQSVFLGLVRLYPHLPASVPLPLLDEQALVPWDPQQDIRYMLILNQT